MMNNRCMILDQIDDGRKHSSFHLELGITWNKPLFEIWGIFQLIDSSQWTLDMLMGGLVYAFDFEM